MRRYCGLFLAMVLVLGACSESSLTLGSGPGSGPDGGRGTGPAGTTPPADEVRTDPDEVVQIALDDLEAYWDSTYPEIYDGDFEPLAGGFVPYGPTSPTPQCGPDPLSYDDIAGNALYCPDEDLIAWDRAELIPSLQEQYGPLTVGIVMAHEYAHAIQARADVRGRTVTLELQADCFAGGWVADVADRIPTFATAGDALDQAVGGFLELRDTIGVSARDPNAHGSGFDRVSAFQDGFEGGAAACTSYEADPPAVVAIPFGSLNDRVQGGNLPLDELIDPLAIDLESFYTALFDEQGETWDPVDDFVAFDPAADTVTCGTETFDESELELASFYCVPEDTIYIDLVGLIPALEEIGDFAFGGEFARLYAISAQAQLELLDADPRGLHADCLTGVYAAAQFLRQIPDQQLVLSPGDLDEIVIAFLAFGGDDDVTAFERTSAFRAGFLDGVADCEPFLR